MSNIRTLIDLVDSVDPITPPQYIKTYNIPVGTQKGKGKEEKKKVQLNDYLCRDCDLWKGSKKRYYL